MLRPIINKYIAPMDGSRGSVGGLAASLVFMAAIYFIGVVANYAQSRVMLTVAQNALQKIRDELFIKMQKLPVRFYDTNNNGDLMSRFTNDVDTVGQMLSSTPVSYTHLDVYKRQGFFGSSCADAVHQNYEAAPEHSGAASE